MSPKTDKEKSAIGHFGEQAIASNLERLGWEVSIPMLGRNIDLIATRYFCIGKCRRPTRLWKRRQKNEDKEERKAVLNRCERCHEETVRKQIRFIQVKASTGKVKGEKIDFSFHPKLRYHADPRTFYAWMAIFHKEEEPLENCKFYTYIFHNSDVQRFDNLKLDSYQITDNQQTHLFIDEKTGKVTKKSTKYDYECFEEFLNAWDKLNEVMDIDGFNI